VKGTTPPCPPQACCLCILTGDVSRTELFVADEYHWILAMADNEEVSRCCSLNGRSRHPSVFSHKKKGLHRLSYSSSLSPPSTHSLPITLFRPSSDASPGPSPSFNLVGALPVYSAVLSRISLDTDQLPKSGCPGTYQCRPRRSMFCPDPSILFLT
jgi:hypothetical protein